MDMGNIPGFWILQICSFSMGAILIWRYLFSTGTRLFAIMGVGATLFGIGLLAGLEAYKEAGMLSALWGVMTASHIVKRKLTIVLWPSRYKIALFMVYLQISIAMMYAVAITEQDWIFGLLGILFQVLLVLRFKAHQES